MQSLQFLQQRAAAKSLLQPLVPHIIPFRYVDMDMAVIGFLALTRRAHDSSWVTLERLQQQHTFLAVSHPVPQPAGIKHIGHDAQGNANHKIGSDQGIGLSAHEFPSSTAMASAMIGSTNNTR